MARAIIIIPCYNEETRLSLHGFCSFASVTHDIIFLFVDDGSIDNTGRLLQSLQGLNPSRFRVTHLNQNCGKAEAVRQGVLAALESSPDYVGFWDADLATPLEAILEFIDFAEIRPEIEMIIGARVRLLGRTINRRPSRHYLGRIFATLVSIILELGVYDTQCGAKLFRVSSNTRTLFEKPFLSRWIFDVEIIARLIRSRVGTSLPDAGKVIYEFPVTLWSDVPGSKLSYRDFVRAAWELYLLRNHYFRTPFSRLEL